MAHSGRTASTTGGNMHPLFQGPRDEGLRSHGFCAQFRAEGDRQKTGRDPARASVQHQPADDRQRNTQDQLRTTNQSMTACWRRTLAGISLVSRERETFQPIEMWTLEAVAHQNFSMYPTTRSVASSWDTYGDFAGLYIQSVRSLKRIGENPHQTSCLMANVRFRMHMLVWTPAMMTSSIPRAE